eukprot:CAMPEP_0174742224 /NCGR_PEP_ID=MMETSP1094-20130205/78274_1 /TAXON_ID=156173 /ORGANISM="Chrysochromulina brevifilum, Strain UTEX LB 985" /LENGTH=36 /DNA_ID= /DNA_START= /DNA_END= /DNA_ORIENTATION=
MNSASTEILPNIPYRGSASDPDTTAAAKDEPAVTPA